LRGVKTGILQRNEAAHRASAGDLFIRVFQRVSSPNTAEQIPRIAKPALIAVPNVARINCSV
jgi:hypothetical protein